MKSSQRVGREPWRRTAWSLVVGGAVVAALMLGVGVWAVGHGAPVGPDQAVTWSPGTDVSVDRSPGRQSDGGRGSFALCTVTPEGEQPRQVQLAWGERRRPYFTGSATITCDQPGRLLTDPWLTTAAVTRGPLIAVPLVAALLGILFFFPRFALLWARSASPLGRFAARLAGSRRQP